MAYSLLDVYKSVYVDDFESKGEFTFNTSQNPSYFGLKGSESVSYNIGDDENRYKIMFVKKNDALTLRYLGNPKNLNDAFKDTNLEKRIKDLTDNYVSDPNRQNPIEIFNTEVNIQLSQDELEKVFRSVYKPA